MSGWDNTPEKRRRDSQIYGAEWRKARAIALNRARRRCEKCGSSLRLQVDHIIPVAKGGSHLDQSNLQVLCEKCHKIKTARKDSKGTMTDPQPSPRTNWGSWGEDPPLTPTRTVW